VTDDDDTSAGCVPYQTQFGVNDDRTLFTQGTFDPGSVANFRGEQEPLLYNELRYTYNRHAGAGHRPLGAVSVGACKLPGWCLLNHDDSVHVDVTGPSCADVDHVRA
jgi:hypothetical protein